MPDPAQRIYALIESDDGGILIAKHSGITKLRNGKDRGVSASCRLSSNPTGCFGIAMVACGSAPWWTAGCCISTTEERICLPEPTACQAASVSALLEDREGSIWVATVDGLDRFRDFAIPTISVQQGLSSQASVHPGRERRQSLAGHV